MAPVIPAENFTDERKEGKTAFTGTHEEVLEKYLWLLDYAQDDFMGTTYTDGNAAFANGAAATVSMLFIVVAIIMGLVTKKFTDMHDVVIPIRI